MREHPLAWGADDEAASVLSPFEGAERGGPGLLGGGSGPHLLGLGTLGDGARLRRLSSNAVASPAVREMLASVGRALGEAADRGRAWRARLDGLDLADCELLFDALGEGEVDFTIAGAEGEGDAHVAEAVLPGVWLGRAADGAGRLAVRWVEVGDAPRALREAALVRPRLDLPVEALSAPRGAMNVMSVLAEVRARARAWTPGAPNHVINFTLFPMTEADNAFLAKALGEVGVRITSGGYGAARVVMTALRHVWAVQYLNGMGVTILDTLEIGDVPAAVLASRTDFEDSQQRLAEIAGAYLQ